MMRFGPKLVFLSLQFVIWGATEPVSASVSQICDAVSVQVSKESGVPLSVLRSITRTETGRTRNGQFEPWPWTVNMEGKGKWFDTEDQARTYVFRHFKRGARSFDIGCFQINYKWHGEAFQSIDEMFDPLANARYAAQFLQRLHDELGDWSKAAGAYHSRTPEYATRYRTRFDRIRSQLPDRRDIAALDLRDAAADTASKPERENAYPLLQAASGSGARGSLVPLGASGRPALIVLMGGT